MQLLTGFTTPSAYRRGFVSIGNFDGVHRGHQVILRRLAELARSAGVPAVVLTFEPSPAAVLAPGRVPPRLTTLDRKAELVGECGIDAVIAIPPTRDLLGLGAHEFFESIIVREIQASGIIEGPNFCFGRARSGTTETLCQLGKQHGVAVEIVDPQKAGEELVSSTVVRNAISEGNCQLATQLLGRPHRVSGKVTTGEARGRQLGFPTANLMDIPELLPPVGVYAGLAVYQGRKYVAAIHLGPNPTFGENLPKLEVHLLDFEGDLYGKTLAIDLLARMRDVRPFATVDALLAQLQVDVTNVRRACVAFVSASESTDH